MVIAGIR